MSVAARARFRRLWPLWAVAGVLPVEVGELLAAITPSSPHLITGIPQP
jgi:hypothetical protein